MAWWSKIPGVNRIGRAIQRLTGPTPAPLPIPQPQQTYPLPWRYTLPEPVPTQPSDYGNWPIGEEEEDIGGYTPIYDDSGLYGGEPDEVVTLYDRNFQPIEYNRVTGEPIQMSSDEWYRETFRSGEELTEMYGIDNIDILKDLYDQGYIDDDDWDTWREIYGEMFA